MSDVATATLMLALVLRVAAALYMSETTRAHIPRVADGADLHASMPLDARWPR
jgi:hypothetical protein